MPLLRIPGLPDFNGDGSAYLIDDFAGWWDTPAVRATMVGNGGGHGTLAVGVWDYAEKYSTLSGTVLLPADQQEPVARALRTAFPPWQDSPLGYVGEDWEADKQVFVRCYDKITIQREPNYLAFAIPLVQTDPLKYGLAALEADYGVFTGQTYFRKYAGSGSSRYRTYAGSGSTRYRTYALLVPQSRPPSASLESDGDVISNRVTISVNGPLPVGWSLVNESTGQRIRASVSIPDGMSATFDSRARTANLGGSDITDRTFGNWLSLAPGTNTFRLYSGTITPAYAVVSALPAYL